MTTTIKKPVYRSPHQERIFRWVMASLREAGIGPTGRPDDVDFLWEVGGHIADDVRLTDDDAGVPIFHVGKGDDPDRIAGIPVRFVVGDWIELRAQRRPRPTEWVYTDDVDGAADRLRKAFGTRVAELAKALMSIPGA